MPLIYKRNWLNLVNKNKLAGRTQTSGRPHTKSLNYQQSTKMQIFAFGHLRSLQSSAFNSGVDQFVLTVNVASVEKKPYSQLGLALVS